MEKIDTLVIDKTGTLTEGKPKAVKIVMAQDFNEDQILTLAAALEQGSEHPLAHAIVNAAREKNLIFSKAQDFDRPPEKALSALLMANLLHSAISSSWMI